jgi:prepilin-type N-terminal cleavage/methylation domain-containing protein
MFVPPGIPSLILVQSQRPRARWVNHSTYLQSATSFGRNFALIFRKNCLATLTHDESKQPSALSARERRFLVRRQKERIGNRLSLAQRMCASSLQRFNASTLQHRAGFTLLELVIVVGIIGLLLVLIAPAFTTIKGGTNVTSAAYAVKGVLDTARTYAKANNTYTWVGFFEEDVSQPSTNPATPGPGRLVLSIVASKDGSIIYDPINLAQQDLTTGVIQVGKLVKIDNVHLWTHTDSPSGTGSTFPTRRNVSGGYCIGDTTPGNSTTPFGYPVGSPAPASQYTFRKAIQFSPRGEARINNSTVDANGAERFPLQSSAEIGLEPTHGPSVPVSIPGNVFAVQFTGVASNVSIYRQ